MSRGFDFLVVGIIWIVAATVHLMAVELFAPGTALHSMASTNTAAVKGAERADLWFQVLSVWVPLFAVGGISAWAFIREFRRQIASAPRPAP